MFDNTLSPKPTVGISRCLLGDKVRYDGKHKRHDTICTLLSRVFIFQPFCPEVAIGLGIPRPPIQLVQYAPLHQQPEKKTLHIAEVNNKNNDYTKALKNYAQHIACAKMSHINGFIFKKNSPSCGINNVNVYDYNGKFLHKEGIGLFAYAIKQQYPLLPTVDEEYLSNPTLCEKFIARVYAHHKKQT